jgi:hypothetical protein
MYIHDVLIAVSFYDPLFISLDGTPTSECRFHTQKENESMTFHLHGKKKQIMLLNLGGHCFHGEEISGEDKTLFLCFV